MTYWSRLFPGQGWHRRANAQKRNKAPLTGNRSTKPPRRLLPDWVYRRPANLGGSRKKHTGSCVINFVRARAHYSSPPPTRCPCTRHAQHVSCTNQGHELTRRRRQAGVRDWARGHRSARVTARELRGSTDGAAAPRFNPRTRARASPQPSALYYGTSCSACGEGQAEGRREGRGTDLARGRNTAAKDRNAPSASRRAGAG